VAKLTYIYIYIYIYIYTQLQGVLSAGCHNVFVSCTLYQIKNDDMVGACSTHWNSKLALCT
jgi:hypothetical protein